MSIRTKIILIFSLISALIVGSSAGVSYSLIKNLLTTELKGRIFDIVQVGASSIDKSAYKRLVKKVSADLDKEEISDIEQSDDYKLVYTQLNAIKSVEKGLIRYVYTLVPTSKPEISRFVVDGDVLALLEEAQKKGKASEEISHFAQEYDISSPEFRYLKKALQEKTPFVESEMTYDKEYDIHAVSAYAPIFDKDGKTFLGILGMDMSDKNIQNALRKSTILSIILVAASIVIAFVASFLSGTLISRGIIMLTGVTKEFASKNFEARAKIHSKDEVGQLGNSFNNMAQTIQDYASYLEKLLQAYNYFVPHAFLKLLGKETIIDVKLGDQVQEEMSILFSDIRSFTTLSESMTPNENFNFINAYLKRVGPLIRDNNGIIDKYIGDAVMALFPNEPDDALFAAVQMQRKVREYNHDRAKAGYRPLVIGIGIHTGKLMLGTVGESERMNGTVISDAVNLASRLEGVTKIYTVGVIISDETLHKLKNPSRFYIRRLDKIAVKGKKEPVSIFEVFNGDPDDTILWKHSTKDKLEEGISLYYARNFQAALNIFRELSALQHNDKVVEIYSQRCNYYIAHGVNESWDGTEILKIK